MKRISLFLCLLIIVAILPSCITTTDRVTGVTTRSVDLVATAQIADNLAKTTKLGLDTWIEVQKAKTDRDEAAYQKELATRTSELHRYENEAVIAANYVLSLQGKPPLPLPWPDIATAAQKAGAQ